MEPILNEHEVIKFLVAKGGRCTNFELVSNFRGALNDPHLKAEARLRFKDIINTVATVGEFQNVKYIELKKEHCLNNASDSPPSSMSSESSYSSPLSQSFQPYWRYRLSTSKQQLPQPKASYHRSFSEGHSLQQQEEDQVVPGQRQEIVNFLSGDFSDDSAQALQFCNSRSRAASEPPAQHRRFSSSDGYQHRENQPHGYQPHGSQSLGYQNHENRLPGYQHHGSQSLGYQNPENQPPGYQHHGSQSLGYQHPESESMIYQRNGNQPPVYQQHRESQSLGYQHQVIQPPVYQNNENKQGDPGYRHHERQYQHPQNQIPVYHTPGQSPQASYQNLGQQTFEDRNTRHQDAKLKQMGQQYQHFGNKSPEYWNTGQEVPGLQKTGHAFPANRPVGHQQNPLPDRHHSHADYQSQNLNQDLIRQQQFNEPLLRPHLDGEKQTGHLNFHKPAQMGPSVQRSSSGRSYGSQNQVPGPNPEPPFSRRMESLHGIRSSDTSRDYSSLPYESPSAYSISDISPQGTNDSNSEDLQTSANLRNVAKALFKDPSKTSRRAPYEPSPRFENVNSDRNIVGLPNTNHAQRSNDHSIPNQLKYADTTNTQQITNKGQGFGVVGLPDRPMSLSESSNPVDQGPIVPNRSRSFDSSRMNNSNHSGILHSNSNRTVDSPNHSRQDRIESPRSSINSSPFADRHSSSIRSNHSVSMVSLDSEKELSNGSPPPPLPPDRRKKLPPPPDDNNEPPPPVSCSGVAGKVRDRVQHFDQMEQQRRHSKRTHSPPLAADKENARGQHHHHHKGLGMEDDVSISVLDPKLKREWCVKCSQCDYHALSGLLKKEPKLAALKDTATTALHWAAKQGDANVVKLIAGAYRVNPNVRSGYTPVHLATLYKHDMIVHLLVHTYGADPSLRDYSGKRADQYPSNYIKSVAGHDTSQRRIPLKPRPVVDAAKEAGGVGFLRIGSLNLRKSSRKAAVFASVRGSTRHWGSASELRLGGHSSMRKKLHKSMISAPERIGEVEKKNDSDSDSTYGFTSKKHPEN